MKGLGRKAAQLLGALAPTLGMALGGPLGGVAGKFLADALGVKPGDVNAAILSGDPVVVEKLARIDAEFEVRMAELGVDLEQMAVDNTKSARAMAQATSIVPQLVLSVVFIVGYFGLMYMLFSGALVIPEAFMQTSTLLIGVLTVNIPIIMQFWFGSSAGSKAKTAQSTIRT